MALTANWNFPTAIRFGAGRVSELGHACRAAGITRPLLVTDPGVAPLDITAGALEALAGAGLEAAVFSEVQRMRGTALDPLDPALVKALSA